MNDSRLKHGVSNEPRTRDIALEGRSVSNYTILTFIVNNHNMNCFLKISSDFENLLFFFTGFSINRYKLQCGADGRIRTCEAFALIYDTSPVDHLGNVGIEKWRQLFTFNTHNMKCFLKISSDFENLLCFFYRIFNQSLLKCGAYYWINKIFLLYIFFFSKIVHDDDFYQQTYLFAYRNFHISNENYQQNYFHYFHLYGQQ